MTTVAEPELTERIRVLVAERCYRCREMRCTWFGLYRFHGLPSKFWTKDGAGFRCTEFKPY